MNDAPTAVERANAFALRCVPMPGHRLPMPDHRAHDYWDNATRDLVRACAAYCIDSLAPKDDDALAEAVGLLLRTLATDHDAFFAHALERDLITPETQDLITPWARPRPAAEFAAIATQAREALTRLRNGDASTMTAAGTALGDGDA